MFNHKRDPYQFVLLHIYMHSLADQEYAESTPCSQFIPTLIKLWLDTLEMTC